MKIPEFGNKKELFDFIVKNESRIIADKKAQMKCTDAFCFGGIVVEKDGTAPVEKANKPVTDDVDSVKVKAVINTTGLMDTYGDVHIPGLWKKSLRENKDIFHDQEHKHEFASTISDYDDLKAMTETFTWKDLGQKYDGETEALVFVSDVKKDRNEFMFGQYKAGRVKQHSVGMIYVKIFTCIADKSYQDYYRNWEKYIKYVANKEDAEENGYFWAVTEAKVIEGSAVKRGANWATPTLDNNMKSEPDPEPTPEPVKTTQLTSDEIIQHIEKHFKKN